MKTLSPSFKKFIAVTSAALFLAACASPLSAPDGSAAARSRLTLLQGDAELATRAPIEIRDAEAAVSAAERPQRDSELGRHLVLIAEQKVEIARAWAQSRLYEDQRADLAAQSEAARLESRTREANLARSDASAARDDAERAREATAAARSQARSAQSAAESARSATSVARGQTAVALSEADAARRDAEAARAESEDLQRQITELNARPTDRGLVVTLGDVLFETGKADLRGGTAADLDRLVTFLNRYPERTVVIEGHTDSVGSDSSNIVLSQNRADSVQAYLVGHGIGSNRISTLGKGEMMPVASNDSSTGRQQNRRVEVIISNPSPLSR
jgi:outer membrane protein OmpA-like peptidoglycan-associated protein